MDPTVIGMKVDDTEIVTVEFIGAGFVGFVDNKVITELVKSWRPMLLAYSYGHRQVFAMAEIV